ncbi:amino acid racemase [Salmonella enterica subsp. enterica]|nr:amino acid racemase [Salmonella enterica subsp. enterica]
MYMPVLEINLRKLEENARTEKALLASSGIDVMAVNKVFDGCVETAQAVFNGGITVIAESRTYNFEKNTRDRMYDLPVTQPVSE